jgi:hypothetical protein
MAGAFKNFLFADFVTSLAEERVRMKTGLDAAGLTVWPDMDRLGAGDDYSRKI